MIQKTDSGGLPSGYTAVNYLRNISYDNGRYYFDTGVIATQNTAVTIKLAMHGLTGTGYFLLGARTNANSTDQFMCFADGRNLFRFDGSTTATDVGAENDVIRIVKYSSNGVVKMDADGNVIKTGTVQKNDDFTGSHSLLLCQSWQNGIVSGNPDFRGNIYYVKIYDGENLVRDFLPCLDAEGIPCLYDTVEQQTYYNQGTGSFTWG